MVPTSKTTVPTESAISQADQRNGKLRATATATGGGMLAMASPARPGEHSNRSGAARNSPPPRRLGCAIVCGSAAEIPPHRFSPVQKSPGAAEYESRLQVRTPAGRHPPGAATTLLLLRIGGDRRSQAKACYYTGPHRCSPAASEEHAEAACTGFARQFAEYRSGGHAGCSAAAYSCTHTLQ